MLNHYWQLIQKNNLFGLRDDTRIGVIRTVKPVLAEGEQLPVWANASRHALVQQVSATMLQLTTPLLDDPSEVVAYLRAGLSRVWAALPENGKLPVFTTGLENNQRIRIVLPEVLFERLYTAENFQGNGPDYVTYRNQIYDLVADGLITQLPLLTYLFAASPAKNGRAFWPAPDQERQLVQKVSDPDHLARTLALDVAVELDPYAASGVTEQMLNFLIDSCWFALSQPAIPLPAAAEVRRHSLAEAQKIAAGDPTAPVASLTAPIDAMAVWLNQVGLTPQRKQAFELMQSRVLKPETTIAGQVAAAYHDISAAQTPLATQAHADLSMEEDLPGFSNLSGNSQALLHAVIDGGYQWTLLDREQNILQIASDTQRHVLIDGALTSRTPASAMVVAEHRHAAKKVLAAAGLPVARGAKFTRWPEAKAAFEQSFARKSIVVKPEQRSHGLAVEQFAVPPTTKQFAQAFHAANQDHGVLVEMMGRGTTYHFTVIGRRVVSVLENAAANVVGDGRKSIKELIALKNGKRPNARQLKLDETANRQLKLQSVTMNTVLRRGQQIFLASAAHPQTGGDIYDVTTEIDPSYNQLAVAAADALELPIAAVDIVIDNLYAAYAAEHEGQAIIISVDPIPDLTLPQQPDMGAAHSIAPALLTYLFSEK